jgi:expansin
MRGPERRDAQGLARGSSYRDGAGARNAPLASARSILGYASAMRWYGLFLGLAACGSSSSADGGPQADAVPGPPFGQTHTGEYHLGPVDFAETQYHNACAPYPAAVQAATGTLLAGVSDGVAQLGSLCDACIRVETGEGRSAVLRVVTYGQSNAVGDLDVSPEAYALLNGGEFPRSMEWQLVRCPDAGSIQLQYKDGSNPWWSSLWVRNPALAIARVEVRRADTGAYRTLELGGDGTFTDASGFGDGAFTLRVTAVDGSVVEIPQTGFAAGSVVDTGVNFP